MFKSEIKSLKGDRLKKFLILESDRKLCYGEVLNLSFRHNSFRRKDKKLDDVVDLKYEI